MSPNFKFDVLTTNECERTNASLSFYFFNSETARIFYFWDNSPTLYDVHERDGVCTKTFVSTKLYFEVTFSSKSSKSLLIFQNISFFHGISKWKTQKFKIQCWASKMFLNWLTCPCWQSIENREKLIPSIFFSLVHFSVSINLLWQQSEKKKMKLLSAKIASLLQIDSLETAWIRKKKKHFLHYFESTQNGKKLHCSVRPLSLVKEILYVEVNALMHAVFIPLIGYASDL